MRVAFRFAAVVLPASVIIAVACGPKVPARPVGPRAADGRHLDVMPVLIPGSCTRPAYPRAMLEEGVSGEVLLEFSIDTTGHVMPNSVRAVGGDLRFAEAATFAQRKCRFTAARIAGRPVVAVVRAAVGFETRRAS